jgi:N-methylhydantoinase A
MTGEGLAALGEAGCAPASVRLEYGADLRYFGQQNELSITFARDPRRGRDAEMIRAAFERAYLAQYGVNPSHVPLEIVSWRLTALGPEIPTGTAPVLAKQAGSPRGRRPVALWGDEVPVFDRAHLALGQDIAGPAIIEERETTIVLPPDWSARIDALGCVVAEKRLP